MLISTKEYYSKTSGHVCIRSVGQGESLSLPSPYTASFQALSVNAFSVTYPRRKAGRCLDNLGVHMREHFCIFEKFTRSTEIIYK